MSGDKVIRVGSRKSELALIQTHHVIDLLKSINPEKTFELVTMSTLGDKVLDTPLPKIGEKSLFTKELEAALVTGCVDFVVHSLKDLPTTLPEGMAIGAVLKREDPRDALVLQKDCQDMTLDSLPKNSTIGTSSLRRAAQLAKKYPHLKVENIRGNLNTRLRKLDDLGQFQAIILAASGLIRMKWEHRISTIINQEVLLYAVGQGALAVECRENDLEIINLLEPLYDSYTALRIVTERSFLRTLGGGCSAPVAVISDLVKDQSKYKIQLTGAVWSLDGKDEIKESDECSLLLPVTCICDEKQQQEICPKITDGAKEKCPFKRNRNNNEEESECSSSKIAKVDDLTEILKNDPHEHCPVSLPIGVDFMGKCPYIESSPALTQNLVNPDPKKCPVFAKFESANNTVPTRCPFMKDGKIVTISNTEEKLEESSKKSDSYVGLIRHPEIPEECFRDAEELGVRLAKKLIEKGAGEVMAKAQAVIRGS